VQLTDLTRRVIADVDMLVREKGPHADDRRQPGVPT